MTYARLEDSFRDHPRFLEMSCAAVGMWASALAYCNKHMTNGRVPAAAVVKLAPSETPKQRANIVAELLRSGAWERNDDGSYLVHDYLDWNDSREKILAKREADRVRKESARNPSGRPSGQPSAVRAESARSHNGLSRAPAGAGATDGLTEQTQQSGARARVVPGPEQPTGIAAAAPQLAEVLSSLAANKALP